MSRQGSRERLITLGVSLKMYFGYQQTVDWCQRIHAIVQRHPLGVGGTGQVVCVANVSCVGPCRLSFC
ncbi:MAG: hypothetical protein ACMZI0_16670 [Symbiopectobacterium sp.]|uniref:hypothetical protein n=1 Tax=Symbiopectobacterium sp. TaxID=2952789 RepID=UPI0039EBDA62